MRRELRRRFSGRGSVHRRGQITREYAAALAQVGRRASRVTPLRSPRAHWPGVRTGGVRIEQQQRIEAPDHRGEPQRAAECGTGAGSRFARDTLGARFARPTVSPVLDIRRRSSRTRDGSGSLERWSAAACARITGGARPIIGGACDPGRARSHERRRKRAATLVREEPDPSSGGAERHHSGGSASRHGRPSRRCRARPAPVLERRPARA